MNHVGVVILYRWTACTRRIEQQASQALQTGSLRRLTATCSAWVDIARHQFIVVKLGDGCWDLFKKLHQKKLIHLTPIFTPRQIPSCQKTGLASTDPALYGMSSGTRSLSAPNQHFLLCVKLCENVDSPSKHPLASSCK